MKDNDAILVLLQDIKEILYGIALMLLSGILCIVGAVLGGWGLLLLAVGVLLLFGGCLYARHGLSAHEVVDKKED
jgi:hypothetical protein